MKKFFITLLIVILIIAGYFVIRSKTSTVTIPTGWVAYTGNGVQFFYPTTFGATVWKATMRPPVLTVVPADKDAIAIGCPMLQDSATITESGAGVANNITYTFYKGGDIGAGTLYTSECYIFSGENQNYVLDFEIRSHSGCENGNCGAYCDTPSEQACRAFDMEKDVKQPIEKIVSTFKIMK